mmetsp:Transcript_56575/g.183946  ORF Transcript_56575/g.183946 Transcript_56575/m.183946 type:complete len:217 (+) Transcript_56575:1029-1679(+)
MSSSGQPRKSRRLSKVRATYDLRPGSKAPTACRPPEPPRRASSGEAAGPLGPLRAKGGSSAGRSSAPTPSKPRCATRAPGRAPGPTREPPRMWLPPATKVDEWCAVGTSPCTGSRCRLCCWPVKEAPLRCPPAAEANCPPAEAVLVMFRSGSRGSGPAPSPRPPAPCGCFAPCTRTAAKAAVTSAEGCSTEACEGTLAMRSTTGPEAPPHSAEPPP